LSNFVLARAAKGNATDIANAEKWNTGLEIGLFSVYALANLVIFVPPWVRQAREVRLVSPLPLS
jgi:hypothetical protein